MANQLTMADIQKIQALSKAGWSARRIARELGCNRGTASKYIAQLRAQETNNALAENDHSKPAKVIAGKPASRSCCEPYQGTIESLLEKGLSAERVYQELVADHQFEHSYPSVSRFVRKLKTSEPKRIWRMECEPGEEAQIDFGVAKILRNAKGGLSYANVLRVTLSHSRKAYTEAVARQDTECFIRAIENAFRHFGGTPKTLRIDNLKAGVKKPDWYDPELNPKMQAFADHYGTTVIPTRPYTPQHKGKVESDVKYVKNNALKGKEFASINELNTYLKKWEQDTADKRIHGTTRKQVDVYFQKNEVNELLALPDSLFPCYQEAKRCVHRDGYIEVAKAYYEVPVEHSSRKVWVRWDSKMVHIFDQNMEKLKSHVRKEEGTFSKCLGARGIRVGKPNSNTKYWISRAETYGEHVGKWANSIATNRREQAIRVLQGLLSLGKDGKHLVRHIDQACKIALANGELNLRCIKHYLVQIESDPSNIAIQEQFPFTDTHDIIRPLDVYAEILNQEAKSTSKNNTSNG